MALASCTDRETREVLDNMVSYMSERPDSALTLLDSIDEDDLHDRMSKAQYALLYSMALDKCGVDVKDDRLVTVATDWYRHNGTPDGRLRAFYYHGRVLQNAGDNEMAMEYFVRAENYVGDAADEYAKGLLYSAIGNVYMDIFEVVMANEAYVRAKGHYFKAGKIDKYVGMLMNIARYEMSCRNYEKAAGLFREARSSWDGLAPETRSLYYFGLISLYKETDDKAALRDCIREYVAEVGADYVKWLKLAEGYCCLEDYQEAMSSLEKYRTYNAGYEEDPTYQICAYELYYSLGMVEEALEAYKKYTRILNDTAAEIITQDTAFVKERYKRDVMIIKRRNAILIILLCVFLSVMLLLTLIRRIRTRLKIKEEENQRYLEECSYLESERDTLAELLQDNCLVGKDARDVINSRLDLLNRFFTSAIQGDRDKDRAASKEFDSLIDNKEKFLHDTRMVFSGVYPKFISFLEDKGLSESQIEVCCLYALGLKGKDVISYTNRKRHYIVPMFEIQIKLE